jgi:UDP-N-acetylglucosamine acyltransferase
VHQFCRIGGGALISGNAVITEDVPPNALAHGRNLVAGLNLVGMRRRVVSAAAVAEIKRAYHAVYASQGACAALAQVALTSGTYQTAEARDFLNFFLGGKRGRFVSPA